MNTELAKKLIDLYLDGNMDLEMVGEFREAMRQDQALATEVNDLRTTRDLLMQTYAADAMSHDESLRVYRRVMRAADPSGRALQNPAEQLEIPWSNVPANDYRL